MKFAVNTLLVAVVALACNHGGAQTFPSGPVKIIVPFPPGGGTDILARPIAQKLNERFKLPVVLENRGGANGTIGTAYVAKSAPADGHTLLIVPSGYAVNPSLYPNLPYDQARDLAAVTQLVSGPLTLVTHPSLPVKNVRELITLAKARPAELNYGSSGAGTSVHLSAELFSSMTGVRMVHVPFKGATEALTALLGGQLDLMFASLSSSIPLIKAGRLRAFAVTGAQRSPSLPDMPTMAEAGLPGYAAAAWYGIAGPAALPPNTVNTLNSAAVAVLGTSDVKARLFSSGVEVRTGTPEEFARLIDSEIVKWAKVVKDSGAKAE